MGAKNSNRNQFFLIKIILYCFIFGVVLGDDQNYPDNNKCQPCARKQAMVMTQYSLCVPDINSPGKFTDISVDNCAGSSYSFRSRECPEFNKGQCVYYLYIGPCKANILIPACRLYYKAGIVADTWMEIFYVNQFGTNTKDDFAVSNILELHRNVYFKFEGAKQNDYPENVLDPKSVGGFKWTDVSADIQKHVVEKKTVLPDTLCKNGSLSKDETCLSGLKNVVIAYPPFWKEWNEWRIKFKLQISDKFEYLMHGCSPTKWKIGDPKTTFVCEYSLSYTTDCDQYMSAIIQIALGPNKTTMSRVTYDSRPPPIHPKEKPDYGD